MRRFFLLIVLTLAASHSLSGQTQHDRISTRGQFIMSGIAAPSCASGQYFIFVDNVLNRWRKCENGTISNMSPTAIGTLNTLTAATQFFADVDDTNVTLAISSLTDTHTFTVGWTGTLAKARTLTTTVYTDQANVYGAFAQDFGGSILEIPNSITPPAAAVAGRIFYDTDAAAGSRLLIDTGTALVGLDNPFGAAIDDGELTSNYSGVGACAANTFASTLNDNAAPTCTQPSFSNLSGSATKSQLPTVVVYEDEANIFTVAGGLTLDNQLGLRLRETTANGTEFIEHRATSAITTSQTYTWPVSTDSRFLFSGTGGALAWSEASGVGGCTNQFARTLNNNAAPTCATVAASDTDETTFTGITWGANADFTWTFDSLGASNPVLSLTGANINVSTGGLQVGGSAVATAANNLSFFAATTSAQLRGVLSDEVGTGSAMFGLISTMNDDLACAGSQVVRRNSGDTAFECATISSGGAPTDATYLVQTAHASLTAEQLAVGGAGIGITFAGGDGGNATFATASSETDFLASGALTCGAATQGKAQVHTTPLQYCDNAATPALQYAAYGDSAGAALTGDTATSFFSTGVLEDARLSTNVALYNNGSKTWGSGAGFNWTFDAGATDPVFEFTSGNVKFSGATTYTFEGGVTDPTWTPGNGTMNLSTGTLQEGGVPVSLPARSETLTNKTLDAEGAGNAITTVQKFILQAAGCQEGTAFLAMETPVGTADTAPTEACNNTGSIQRPSADYSGSVVNSMEFSFKLPSDWTGSIDLAMRYVTVAASPTGNVEWDVSTVCRAVGESWDAAFNAAQTITDAVGAQNALNDATQTTLTVTGCAASEDMTIKISRDGTNDTNNDLAKLLYAEVTLRRTQ